MIIQCPRCGFSQPEDQYCAQCGVNMQSFQRKEKSFWQKIFENLGLQVILLLIIAGLVGTYMIQGGSTPQWAQKLTKFQGVSKSKRIETQINSANKNISESPTADTGGDNLKELTNKEISIQAKTSAALLEATSAANRPAENPSASVAKSLESKELNADPSSIVFRLTYAEVSTEVLAKWISESSRLGLFQNLQDYSAGIIPDFKKRSDPLLQNLKTAEKKLSPGQSETNLSGTVSDDGTQMIGLSVSYDFRSLETTTIHGSVVVTKANRQTRENYPAEFDLPKGAVFFMVDTLTRASFRSDKSRLSMAPFQILNSMDFNSQKSKFVIIIEPELK